MTIQSVIIHQKNTIINKTSNLGHVRLMIRPFGKLTGCKSDRLLILNQIIIIKLNLDHLMFPNVKLLACCPLPDIQSLLDQQLIPKFSIVRQNSLVCNVYHFHSQHILPGRLQSVAVQFFVSNFTLHFLLIYYSRYSFQINF